MFRASLKLLLLAALLAAGSVGYWAYDRHFTITAQVRELQQQKQALERVVQRFSAERRVAEVFVTHQETLNGRLRTTFLFDETPRGQTTQSTDSPLPPYLPKTFTIDGNLVHLDAMVIKFDRDFVAKDDPLRGHSIALFTKLYGETQEPEKGFPIDAPGQVPDLYRGADPQVSEFEQSLWRDFWKLADDAAYRQQKGVRVANGQGLWWPLEKDRIYTITIESNGGLNCTAEPLKPILRQAMKSTAPSP